MKHCGSSLKPVCENHHANLICLYTTTTHELLIKITRAKRWRPPLADWQLSALAFSGSLLRFTSSVKCKVRNVSKSERKHDSRERRSQQKSFKVVGRFLIGGGQACQLSRIFRESHGFRTNLTYSRVRYSNSRILVMKKPRISA